MRKLLPKPHEEDQRESQSSPPTSRKHKRQQVSIACGGCRRRKIKCDNQRPACTPCLQSELDCHFAGPKDRGLDTSLASKLEEVTKNEQDLKTILELLRRSSFDESTKLLQRIREAPSVNVFLETFAGASLLLPGLPPSRNSVAEFSQHPSTSRHGDFTSNDGEPTSVLDDVVAKFPDGVLPIAQWTSLSTDDRYLTHLVNLFFTWDNTSNHIIHRPMFLQDLRAGTSIVSLGLTFCSKFLIHSILAVAHLYMSQGISPNRTREVLSKGRSYAEVALGMLETERVTTSIPLAQGLALLWIFEFNHGSTALAIPLLEDFYRVYDDLSASDAEIPLKHGEPASELGKDWEAVSYTIWGFFCLEAKISITLSRAMRIRKPKIAKTFEDVHTSTLANPEAPGYFWFPYPESGRTQPSFLREVVSIECDLAELVREASRFFVFSDPETPLPHYPAVRTVYETLVRSVARNTPHVTTPKGLLPSTLFLGVTLDMVALKLLSCLCRFPSNSLNGETAASVRASYGASIISNLHAYQAAYGIRHEYWLLEACFSATLAVIFKLNDNPSLLMSVVTACQLLYGIGEFFPVANECLLTIRETASSHKVDLPKPCKAIFAKLAAETGRIYVRNVAVIGVGRGEVGLGVGSSRRQSPEIPFSERIESIRDPEESTR